MGVSAQCNTNLPQRMHIKRYLIPIRTQLLPSIFQLLDPDNILMENDLWMTLFNDVTIP